MRVAYVTADEVNAVWAAELALSQEATLFPLGADDAVPHGEFDLVLYDWDSLPESLRLELLAAARTGVCPGRMAIHSYHLPRGHGKTLHQAKVAVYPRLAADLFHRNGSSRQERSSTPYPKNEPAT
jgi:hypothetical protein